MEETILFIVFYHRNKTCMIHLEEEEDYYFLGGHCDCDCMVVGFTTTWVISANHHQRCEFGLRSWQGVLDTTLYDKVC